MKVEFVCAILLVSKDAPRLASFYRDVLGLPLEDEQHGDEPAHFGCELGDIHFAIHPAKAGEEPGAGGAKLAFEIFDMAAYAEQLRERDVPFVKEPKDRGFMIIATIRDPDGNEVEFTQLSDKWFEHIAKRRGEGHDMIAAWKARRQK